MSFFSRIPDTVDLPLPLTAKAASQPPNSRPGEERQGVFVMLGTRAGVIRPVSQRVAPLHPVILRRSSVESSESLHTMFSLLGCGSRWMGAC